MSPQQEQLMRRFFVSLLLLGGIVGLVLFFTAPSSRQVNQLAKGIDSLRAEQLAQGKSLKQTRAEVDTVRIYAAAIYDTTRRGFASMHKRMGVSEKTMAAINRDVANMRAGLISAAETAQNHVEFYREKDADNKWTEGTRYSIEARKARAFLDRVAPKK